MSSTFSNFFLEATGPVAAKLYVAPPLVGGTKVPSSDHGHVTKVAAMPI